MPRASGEVHVRCGERQCKGGPQGCRARAENWRWDTSSLLSCTSLHSAEESRFLPSPGATLLYTHSAVLPQWARRHGDPVGTHSWGFLGSLCGATGLIFWLLHPKNGSEKGPGTWTPFLISSCITFYHGDWSRNLMLSWDPPSPKPFLLGSTSASCVLCLVLCAGWSCPPWAARCSEQVRGEGPSKRGSSRNTIPHPLSTLLALLDSVYGPYF